MPRKSTSSTPGDAEEAASSPQQSQVALPTSQSQSQSQSQIVQVTEQQLKARAEGGVSIEDYLLPRSLTLRLAKGVLPPGTSIQKDAVLAIQKAATVFVSYLSSHANEATLKRTVAPSDVLSAISELELDGFLPRLEKELEAFTELKAGKRRAKKSDPDADVADGPTTANGTMEDVDGAGAGAGAKESATTSTTATSTVRGAKRVKRAEAATGTGAAAGAERMEEDGDETQEEMDENETEVEEEEEEEDEEEEEEEEEQVDEDEDIDRMEEVDRDAQARRTMDPDAARDDDTESDDDSGPASQLRGDLGLG